MKKTKTLKALTVKPPWADLIADGIKFIENRSWRPKLSDTNVLAVHRGGRDGAVVAVARVARVMSPESAREAYPDQDSAGYVGGPECWVLTDIFKLPEPVPCKGKLGLWDLDPDVNRAVLRQTEGRVVPAPAAGTLSGAKAPYPSGV